MSEASRFVALTISIQDASFASPNFGALLVVGRSPTGDPGMHTLAASPAGLASYVTDLSGATTDAVYKQLAWAVSQKPHTDTIKWYNTAITNTEAVKLTPQAPFTVGKIYTITVNGTKVSYTVETADTATEIATGLHTLINPLLGVTSTDAVGSVDLTTADGYTSVFLDAYKGSDLAVTETSTTSAAYDTALAEALAADPDFYGVLIDVQDAANIAAVASWCETNKKQFLAKTRDTTALGGTGVVATLYASGNHYTTVCYSADDDNPFTAGLHGRQLALNPGASDYQFKNIAGTTVDDLTTAEIDAIVNLNGMTYTRTRGRSMTDNGVAASGRPIALVRNLDWLENEIVVNVLTALGGSEIVYLDSEGITQVEGAIREALAEAERLNVLAPGWTVTAPTTISAADKATGLMAGFTFNGETRVGTRKVEIQGTLQ